MKLPEKTPRIDPDIFKKLPSSKIQALFAPSEELKKLYKKANADYLYWDRFKQLEMPEGFKAEEAWFGLKIGRASCRERV